ncbi:MAG TPA: efflux transporter outer membrane subunit [Burkholderiales bacterium]|nr:efflux transporter outer membrane subunit [Burkholderiales bacterium]
MSKPIEVPGAFVRTMLSVAVATTLAACAVGPDFQQPAAPSVGRYTEEPIATETATAPGRGGAAQHFVAGDLPEQWWTLFHSEALDQLVREALEHSPTLAAARATLAQAQENLKAAKGGLLYPSVTGNLTATREKAAASGPGGGAFPGSSASVFNLYNASVDVSYSLDIFGGNRRQLEGQQALVDYQRYQLEGARLALTANVVTAAIREASLRAQLQATRETLAAQEESVHRTQRQFELGGAGRLDLVSVQSQAAQTAATIPPLESALAQVRDQLAVLTGRTPAEAGIPQFEIDALHLPEDLPVSLPSEIVRRRPDIRASEALLHQASAQVGVATANLYPQVTLTGSLSGQATQLHDVLSGPSLWSLGAGIVQPIFRGGQLQAERRAAMAAYDAALAQYQGTVLQAFGNVADALHVLEQDAQTLKAQAEAEKLARERLDLTRKQWELGGTSYLALLDAQRQHALARAALVSVEGARYADTAALFQALGGGWWTADKIALTAGARTN